MSNELEQIKSQCREAHRLAVSATKPIAWVDAMFVFGDLCARLKAETAPSGEYSTTLHALGIGRTLAWRAERLTMRWTALNEVPESKRLLCQTALARSLICELDDLLDAPDIDKLLRNGEWRGLKLESIGRLKRLDFYRAICKVSVATDQEARLREKCLDVVTQAGTADPLGDAKRLYDWINVWQSESGA